MRCAMALLARSESTRADVRAAVDLQGVDVHWHASDAVAAVEPKT